MGDCADKIPIVDFSAYRLSLEKPDRSQFQKLVDDVHKALTTIGFVFIVNTDFQQEKVWRCIHVFMLAGRLFSFLYNKSDRYCAEHVLYIFIYRETAVIFVNNMAANPLYNFAYNHWVHFAHIVHWNSDCDSPNFAAQTLTSFVIITTWLLILCTILHTTIECTLLTLCTEIVIVTLLISRLKLWHPL